MHGDALDDTGVVDEDVDVADLSVNLLHESLYVVLFGHVADISLYVGYAGLFVVIESFLKEFFVDVIEDDGLDAGCNESLCDVEADTIGSAGDPGVLSFKRKKILCHNGFRYLGY